MKMLKQVAVETGARLQNERNGVFIRARKTREETRD
jgi:hypothetical protein